MITETEVMEFVSRMDHDMARWKLHEEYELKLVQIVKNFEKIARCKITMTVKYNDEV